ncbi:MAG: ABC transporter permease [Ignisphaera sp.]
MLQSISWILRRVIITAITWVLAISITVLIILVAPPGDPARTLMLDCINRGGSQHECLIEVQTYLGLQPEEPLIVKWAKWTFNTLTFNLGISWYYRVSVNRIIADAIPWTLFLTSYALILTIPIGILVGIIMAYYRSRKVFFTSASAILSVINAIPVWLIAVYLYLYVGARWELLPHRGPYDINVTPGLNLSFLLSVLHHHLLPALAYFIVSLPSWALPMATLASGILREDYVTIAKARGLPKGRILTAYVMRNSVLPMYTRISLTFAAMLTGAVWIENQFALLGLGRILGAVSGIRDYPTMMGIYCVSLSAIIIGNLLTDLTYALIDPRARLED